MSQLAPLSPTAREAFCGLEYAENAFAAGADPTGVYYIPWIHGAPQIVGWGGDTSPHPAPSAERSGFASPTHNFWLRH